MRKYLSLPLMAFVTLTASAQSYPANGYYRVQNRGNGNSYVTLIDNRGSVDYTSLGNSDLKASRLRPLLANDKAPGVVNDPGSVFFATHMGNGAYDLATQGSSISSLVNGIYLNLKAGTGNADYPWLAYGVKSGVTVYIRGTYTMNDNGAKFYMLGVGNSASGSNFHWAVRPITTNGDNYFGLIPDVTAKGVHYKAFYAAFPFKPNSGMNVYYVTKVDKSRGLVVWKEVTGIVPSSSPVIVKCAGTEATNNRLDLQMTSPPAISGNQLKGVYFSNFENDGHNNFITFDANTMRVLGSCADGSIGYVTPAGLERIPANSSYLVVGQGAPKELKLVTQEDYNKESQAVTITAKSYTRQYGEDNPAFEYTASGTVVGTPEITCEATKTSPVGTYPIVVKAGTVQGTVTTVNGTLTITKAPLTITAKSYTISQIDPLPTFEFTAAGFKNGETSSVLTTQPTLTTNAPSDKKPGTYDITPAGAAATNYDISYAKGTLTITAAPAITITAKDATMVYGDEVPQLQYEVSGGTLTGTPKLVCAATKTSDVDTYDITVDVSAISYPNLKTVNGKLTITKAPVTVKAKSYTIVETEDLPTFEAEYSGWKNGQNESVLTKKATLSCDAPANKTPGTYNITVSGADAKNYSFTYTNGQLTITEAPTITVKAVAKEMTYGDAVPELTYTVEGGELNGKPVLSTTVTSKSDVGEYDITIAKGTINYPRIVLQSAKLTVKKAMLTVNAGTYTMKQGEQRPAFKATYSGWKNDDTEAVLTKQPTLTTNAPDSNEPGEYKVTAAGAEAKNYDFTYVEGKLVITAANAITIVATNATMVYGDEVPELKYTITGGTITGTPQLTCEATKTSDVGEYVIKVENGTVNYHNIVLVNGKLTITKAPISVKAKSYTIVETEALPIFEAEYSGWKNGQNESVLTKKAELKCDGAADKAPGEYDITVSGAEAKNYSFTYTVGKLTITQAPTITVKSETKEMVYGDQVPELTYTVEGGELTGTPVLTCEAKSTSDVGEYNIVITKGNINYPRLTLVNSTLTITPAELTVKAEDATREQGEPNPKFTLTYSGWKNNDTEAVLIQKPVATTEADVTSLPGEYAIVVSGGEAKNYAFKYVNGKLTVTKEDAIVDLITQGKAFDIYTVSGVKVRSNATTLKGLARGIYMINGKKVLVK